MTTTLRLLSKKQVKALVLYSFAHIDRLEKAGQFPKRVRLSYYLSILTRRRNSTRRGHCDCFGQELRQSGLPRPVPPQPGRRAGA